MIVTRKNEKKEVSKRIDIYIRRILFFGVCMVCSLLPAQIGKATDVFYDEVSYDEVQKVIDEVVGDENELSFQSMVKKWTSGEVKLSFSSVGNTVLKGFSAKWNESKDVLIKLCSVALIGALFTNFSDIFKNSQIAESGFYVAYLLLFSILTVAFMEATSITEKTLDGLLQFMKALVPTYFMTVTFAAGVSTSLVFYESTLVLISFVDIFLIHVVLPMIRIYFVFVLISNLVKEDMLSKAIELLETGIGWILKTLFGLVVGFHVIQGMIVPVAEYVKTSAVMKTAKAIPGMGNGIGSVAETIFGASILVKNAVGVAGLVVILVICGLPVIQLGAYTLIYQVSGAVLQPISEKRMLECIGGTSKAVKFLLYTLITAAVLFLFTIAIITNSTSLKLKG